MNLLDFRLIKLPTLRSPFYKSNWNVHTLSFGVSWRLPDGGFLSFCVPNLLASNFKSQTDIIAISYTMQQVNQKLAVPHHFAEYNIYLQTPQQSTPPSKLNFREEFITISSQNATIHQLQYSDLIGFNQQPLGSNLYKVKLNSFPRKQGTCCKKQQRQLQYLYFWVRLQEQQYQDLKVDLLKVITNRRITSSKQKLTFIIYLNPNAGANSNSHFQNVVKFMRLTNLSYEVIETTGQNHCKQHLNALDLQKYEGVIIISGDGLMHQFVNSTACGKIPVTHVPGGSGNAFAKAQTTLAGELCRDEQAIYLAVKGKLRSMNLVKIELEREPQPIYSFLALEWAFGADVDLNSQFLRCCGGFRFDIYGAYRCLVLNSYPGRLTYSTSEVNLPPLNQEITNPSFKVVETDFLNMMLLSIPFISDKYEWAPLLKVEDEAIDLQYITAANGRFQLIKYLLSSDSGDHFDKQKKLPKEGYDFTHIKLKSYRLEPTGEGFSLGLFGIDGQRYQSQRVQACISDKKVLTFA